MSVLETSSLNPEPEPKARKKLWKDLTRVLFVGLFFVAAALLLKHPAIRGQLFDLDALGDRLQDGGVKSSLTFIIGAALINALGLPRIWICGLAGSLFGAVEGMILGYAATLVGSSVNFLMGRSMLRGPIRRSMPERLRPWYRAFNRNGFRAILYMRLFPLANATLTNLMGGASRMTYRAFILATAIGFLPFTVAFATLGSSAIKQSPWQMLCGLLLFAAVGVGQWIWSRKHSNLPFVENADDAMPDKEILSSKGA